MSERRGSIVRRLVIVTLAAGLLTGSVGAFLAQRADVRDLRRAAASATFAAAERTATSIDGRVDAILAQLALLASRPTVATLDPAAETELAVALRVSDDLDALVLYDTLGRPVAASSSVELLDADELEPVDRVSELFANGPRLRIVDTGPLPELELSVPVEDPPGRSSGALVGRAPMQLLTQGAEARLVSSQATGLLVTPGGRIVGHRELDRVLDREIYEEVATFGTETSVTTVDHDDGRGTVIVAGAPSQRLPLWVVVELPEHAALTEAEIAGSNTTLVVLAVVAAIVAAVIAATRRYLRPLVPLAEAVERLGAGERAVRVDETGGSGEVRVLAAGFNRMATRLQERQEELERAERAARRSEQRLRLMVEGVSDYAIFLLSPEGSIDSWNTGARRLLGATEEEARGRPLSSFFDPSDPPEDPFAGATVSGRGDTEGWYLRNDGGRFWCRAVCTALRDEHETPYGYAVVLHDLTERHTARQATEEALQREQEAAEDLRRTNALKDEFLAMAAHELQTPLAAIIGANEILTEPDGLEEPERLHLRRVVGTHADDMKGIVERLLQFTRVQAGRVKVNPEPVSLREEIERQVALVELQLNGHEVNIEAPDTTVHVDSQALRHILGNLLSNAAKFSDAGSEIAVTAMIVDHRLRIQVRDHGIGVPEEDRTRIFELFGQSRTERSTARGTGVGLAIVQRYVELLGGSIHLESEVGRGSTFTVELPVNPERS